jgi:hypothetical protein
MRRDGYLLSQIESLLSPDSLLHNPYLVSRMVPIIQVPVRVLVSVEPIARLRPTEQDILECCNKSDQLDVAFSAHGASICTRFPVAQNVLIIRGIGLKATVFQIGSFIGSLNGKQQFMVYPTLSGYDFAVHFKTIETCIGVWRVLQIVPFQGQLLSVEAYSPIALFTMNREWIPPEGRMEIPAIQITERNLDRETRTPQARKGTNEIGFAQGNLNQENRPPIDVAVAA